MVKLPTSLPLLKKLIKLVGLKSMIFLDLLEKSRLIRNETEILTAFLLKKEREFLLTHLDAKISPAVYKNFKILEKKRLAGWSIAVLIGSKEFYGLKFKVNQNVLVPRPETEFMVEEILNIILSINKKNYQAPMVVDVGTGSGAVAVAVANQLKKNSQKIYNRTLFRATDISQPALCVAKKNSILHKQTRKIKFLHGNLLEPLINRQDFKALINNSLIIAANLPYLTPNQVSKAPSIKKEPRLALVAGRDGLKYYRELFKQIACIVKEFNKQADKKLNFNENKLDSSKLLNNLGKRQPDHDQESGNSQYTFQRTIHVLCEIDPIQTNLIKSLIKNKLSNSILEIKKDFSGQNRLVIITIR